MPFWSSDFRILPTHGQTTACVQMTIIKSSHSYRLPAQLQTGPFGSALETEHQSLPLSLSIFCLDLHCCSTQSFPGNRALFVQICPLCRQGGLTLGDEVDPLMALMLQGSQQSSHLLTHACKYISPISPKLYGIGDLIQWAYFFTTL